MTLECVECLAEVPLLHPGGKCQSCHRFSINDPVERDLTRSDFPWEQSVHGHRIDTLTCAKCKGVSFMVGKGSYRTVIKCVTCGDEETCIHDG